VTPNEWFETQGSKPEIREPPKRRHFATITEVAETRPSQPCEASIYQQQKNAGFQRVSFKTLWASLRGNARFWRCGGSARKSFYGFSKPSPTALGGSSVNTRIACFGILIPAFWKWIFTRRSSAYCTFHCSSALVRISTRTLKDWSPSSTTFSGVLFCSSPWQGGGREGVLPKNQWFM